MYEIFKKEKDLTLYLSKRNHEEQYETRVGRQDAIVTFQDGTDLLPLL